LVLLSFSFKDYKLPRSYRLCISSYSLGEIFGIYYYE